MKSPHSLSISCYIFIISCSSLSSAHAAGAGVRTSGGHEFGLSVSSYRYEEPSVQMSNKGDKFGIYHFGTMLLEGDWFIKDDLRFAFGNVDYVGSGYQAGAPDWYIDARGLLGRDLPLGNAIYSPFIGIGYRFLFNDLRGYSSTGAIGYRRESNYLYVPIGLTHRFSLDESAVLATTLEFDKFVGGKQVTRLSDLSGYSGYSGVTDVENRQKNGFGFRAELLYEMKDLAFGPFINLWRVNESDVVVRFMPCNGAARLCDLSEPQNRTAEFGLRMRFKY